MADEKYTINLRTYDGEDLGEVDASTVARCMTAENFAYLLDCYLNYGGKDFPCGKQTGEELQRTHRTLQRLAIAFALGLIVGISDQEYTDARNETAIATAKKIAEMVEAGELPLGMHI